MTQGKGTAMANSYTHTGDGGPVRAESAKEAANLVARREYGRKGYCRTLRQDSWTEDGRNVTYQAFIGRDVGGATSGRNIWIYETRTPATEPESGQ